MIRVPSNLKKVREVDVTPKELIDFESRIKEKYEDGSIPSPIHLSKNNEMELIQIFEYINKNDWVFCSWRNHYHALLHGFDRQKLIERIKKRVNKMIQNGAIQEVAKFSKLKIKKDKSINKVIGIEEFNNYLNKKITLEQAKELISIKTRQYAKRQSTWARSRMRTWSKIDPNKVSLALKKINKSTLNLDQLI